MDPIDTLLRKHYELDFAIRDRQGKVFYSDWDCYHPFISSYSIDHKSNHESAINLYKFYEDDSEVISKIANFHYNLENLQYSNESILAGDGSTPLISSFCIWLHQKEIEEVFYIPPLYYTFYYFGKLFSISFRPISDRHPFEKDFRFQFPNRRCVLIITDPIWYAGISLNESLINALADWQTRTESMVFVDGSFQYSHWDGQHNELTSRLNHENTARLICPTKAVAIHGFRFSYLLLPRWLRNEIRTIFANSHGATTAHNLCFAKHVFDVLCSGSSNSELMEYIAGRYRFLVNEGWIESELEPNAGYFIFAKPTSKALNLPQLSMGGQFFHQTRYNDYVRFNLLAPDMHRHVYNTQMQS